MVDVALFLALRTAISYRDVFEITENENVIFNILQITILYDIKEIWWNYDDICHRWTECLLNHKKF